MSPAFAASNAIAARAVGPSSATSADKVSGPRELLITTLYPCVTASRAIWLPMCPAPMSPMVVIAAIINLEALQPDASRHAGEAIASVGAGSVSKGSVRPQSAGLRQALGAARQHMDQVMFTPLRRANHAESR